MAEIQRRKANQEDDKIFKENEQNNVSIREQISNILRSKMLYFICLIMTISAALHWFQSSSIAAKYTHDPQFIEQLASFDDGLSLIIPVRDERKYLGRTLTEFHNNTPFAHIHSVCIYDDASKEPVTDWIYNDVPEQLKSKITVIRGDEPHGLMEGRVACAEIMKSKYLFFLDGHTKPMEPYWSSKLLKSVRMDRKRVIVPQIISIGESDWKPPYNWIDNTDGIKMMFDWTFEFYWLNGRSNEIPIMAGGIFAIDRDYFFEIGSYDRGMKEWGAENIEQSMRIWMCGGEIISDTSVMIGHIFDRPPKPNPGNKLVERIQMNHLRVALVWLDELKPLFLKHHHSARMFNTDMDNNPKHPEHNIQERIDLREELQCHSVTWFLTKFRSAFDRHGLVEFDYHQLQVKFRDQAESLDHQKLHGKCLIIKRGSDRTYNQMKMGATSCHDISLTEDSYAVLDGRFINSMGRRLVRVRNQIAKQGEVFRINSHCIDFPQKRGSSVNFTECSVIQNSIVESADACNGNDCYKGGIFFDHERTSIVNGNLVQNKLNENETGLIIYIPVVPDTIEGNDDITKEYVNEQCFTDIDRCLCIGYTEKQGYYWVSCVAEMNLTIQLEWL